MAKGWELSRGQSCSWGLGWSGVGHRAGLGGAPRPCHHMGAGMSPTMCSRMFLHPPHTVWGPLP